jgi:CMP-N-acetylneuraminic acid synthetase
MKTVAFVPMKLNNERLPGKNTLPFRNNRPMFYSIVGALQGVSAIDDVYVYCSDTAIATSLPEGVKFVRRSSALDQSTTKINEVISAFANDVQADTYILAHATAPFLGSASIARLVDSVNTGRHDSALTVLALREFLWRDGSPLNYDPESIPRTQDLPAIHAETSGAWAFGRELAVQGLRVGKRAALIEVSRIEAIDINEPIDFAIAEAVLMSSAGVAGR